MDYSKLSDFEINKLVGDVVFKGLWSCRPGTAGNKSDSWYYGNADASLNPLSPLSSYTKRFVDFSARAQLERFSQQPTHFSPRHITTRTGTKMKKTDATDSQL